MNALDELERDALTELVNIGVSRAASALRKMAGEYILLSVPSVQVVNLADAARLIGEREGDELIAVRQNFYGIFSGRAMLIFPEAQSLELVRAIIRDEVPLDQIADIEHEALAETGNIVLNNCLAILANTLEQPLDMSLPEILRGDGSSLFRYDSPPAQEGLILFLYVNFTLHNRKVRGYIALVMDVQSMAILKQLIQRFVAGVLGESDDEKD